MNLEPHGAGISRRGLLASSLALGVLGAGGRAAAETFPPLATRDGASTVRGRTIPWRAETGETILRNAAGQARATVFSVSYMAKGPRAARRPVTFLWNGGPGGASWHLREHLSPRITVAAPAAPGFRFVDNPSSLIDTSDLVFIDAPGTGYSRILDPSAKPEYWGVEEDGRAFATVIAQWLEAHGRRAAPVFLVAESYGGTRAGQVVRDLAEHAIAVTGVTFISPTLSPLGGSQNWYESYSPALTLAPFASIARFHGRGAYGSASIDEVAAKALAFAEGEYATALRAKASLGSEDRDHLAGKVSAFIGLPASTILANDLVVPVPRFLTDLLADRGLIVDAGDGRDTQPAPPPGQSLSVLTPDKGYDTTASIASLIKDDLGFPAIGPYQRDPVEISRMWNQSVTRTGKTVDILQAVMRENAKLRVFMVGGYYDAIVPYAAPLHALAAALPASRFDHQIYATGHGVYEDVPLRPKTTADLRAFYLRTMS